MDHQFNGASLCELSSNELKKLLASYRAKLPSVSDDFERAAILSKLVLIEAALRHN